MRSEPNDSSLPHRAETAVRAVLPRSVKVRVSPERWGSSLTVNGTPIRVAWIGEGGLRQARDVLARRPAPDVVIARRMSPGAREALSAAKIGWIDETGAAEIVLGSIIVARSGRPDPPREESMHWTPAVIAVAEALLCGRHATVEAMQTATGLSTGSCTRALRVLTGLKLLTSDAARGRGSARRIVDADQLLDAYATAAATLADRPSLKLGVTWRDMVSGLATIGVRWTKAKISWAATGAAAASILAPHLSAVTTAEVYVDAQTIGGLQAVASVVDLAPIEGGRLTIRPFPSVSMKRLSEDRAGIILAPWPRVVAGLRRAG